MWTKEVTVKTGASREKIWDLWSDVKNWNKWDNEVEYSELFGEFITGTSGILKPPKGPKSKFTIVSAKKNDSFTTRSSLPLTKIDFIHEMREQNGELFITHRIEIKGMLTFLFSKVIGEKVIKTLPEALEKLSTMAKKN